MKSEEIEELLGLTYAEDPKVWNRIFALANDSHRSVRAHVLHALGDGSPREREPDVIRTIESMADDCDPKIRRSVRKLLAHYRRTGKINVL